MQERVRQIVALATGLEGTGERVAIAQHFPTEPHGKTLAAAVGSRRLKAGPLQLVPGMLKVRGHTAAAEKNQQSSRDDTHPGRRLLLYDYLIHLAESLLVGSEVSHHPLHKRGVVRSALTTDA